MKSPKNIVQRKFELFLLFLGICCLPACGQKTFDEKMQSLYEHTVPQITADELDSLKKDQLILLDTREKKEFDVSHLPGAKCISYDDFDPAALKGIPKNAEIIVYCSVGYRSERIGEKLQQMGYMHVKNLYGGIFDWKNKGHEIVNNQNQPTDSVHTYNANWSQWLYNGIKVYE